MNKSRKQCSDFARTIAMAPFSTTAVYLVDLFGCGDSEGELVDATWSIWRNNVLDVVIQLDKDHHQASCVLLGIRLGAALALDCVMHELSFKHPRLVFWQPVLNGKQFVSQFMRLKIAASMLTGIQLSMAQIRCELEHKKSVEVSGYTLSTLLVSSLEQLNFHQLEQLPSWINLLWFEVGPEAGNLLAISEKIVLRWQQQNRVVSHFCCGDAFWQSVEITTVAALTELTQSYLSKCEE